MHNTFGPSKQFPVNKALCVNNSFSDPKESPSAVLLLPFRTAQVSH